MAGDNPQPMLEKAIRLGIESGWWTCVAAAWGTAGGVSGSLAVGRRSPAVDAPALKVTDRFDLASITKVLATAPALTLAFRKGLLDLDAQLGDWPQLGLPTPLAGLTIRELVTHTSGLPNRKPDPALRGDDALRDWMNQEPAPPGERVFCYACLNSVLAGFAAQACLGARLDEVLASTISGPLGIDGLRYGPLSDADDTVPTFTTLKPGEVADPPARAIGDPIGNAGVYASALDLAAYASALLATHHGRPPQWGLDQRGVQWMMRRVENPAGVDRGVMWDRRSPQSASIRPAAAGPDDVGHGGWNGHSLWIDPQQDRFVVILTNRSSMPPIGGRTQEPFIETTNRMRGVLADVIWSGF